MKETKYDPLAAKEKIVKKLPKINEECTRCYRFCFGTGMHKCEGKNDLRKCGLFLKIGGDKNSDKHKW